LKVTSVENTNKSQIDLADIALKKIFDNNRTIKKVLLIAPPDVNESLFDYATTKRGRSNNYPPYGLGVIARHLLDNGIDVRICNLNHEILKKCSQSENASQFDFSATFRSKLVGEVEAFQPDLVGVTCLFTVTHLSLVDVCSEVKSIEPSWLKKGSTLPLAVGGVHVTHDIEKTLTEIPCVDFLFLHEAELSFLRFIEVVNRQSSPENLSQLIINTSEDRLTFENRATPEPENLNVIPAFELMDIAEYSQYGTLGSWYGFKKKGTPIATVLSNRGCRAACTFCNVRTFNGVGVRHRSVESVLDELSILKKEYGVGHFIWLDDDLLHDEKRAIQLFEGMVKRNLNMTWDATNGLIAHSLCKEEVVAAAEASGCIGMYLGVESGNPQILKEIKKPGTVETFVKAAGIIRKYEQINARILLIIGFPGETLEMILDTIKLAEKMDLDWCNIAILQPWKSTPIYDAMVEKGLLGEEEGTLKTKGNKIAPYNLGPYSRQRAIERGKLEPSEGLQSIFEDLDLDSIPTPDQLDNIWFYMNYRVNFFKLFRETRQVKLAQQYKWLSYVHTLSAPDNALVMYFYGYLQYRVLGEVEDSLVLKLEDKLAQSDYWRERFDCLGLHPEDLKSKVFPAKPMDSSAFKRSENNFSQPSLATNTL
jgi:radical SAM superfamily enzyme YgiQ (UPF0313 family)